VNVPNLSEKDVDDHPPEEDDQIVFEMSNRMSYLANGVQAPSRRELTHNSSHLEQDFLNKLRYRAEDRPLRSRSNSSVFKDATWKVAVYRYDVSREVVFECATEPLSPYSR
jgi:hypothetical protein